MKLGSWVRHYARFEHAATCLLDEASLIAQGVAATHFYAAYAELETHAAFRVAELERYRVALLAQEPWALAAPVPYVPKMPMVSEDTDLSISEWALIGQLFRLYVEREEAKQLEASRGLGMDVFGRSSSEIVMDIKEAEGELPHRAFSWGALSV